MKAYPVRIMNKKCEYFCPGENVILASAPKLIPMKTTDTNVVFSGCDCYVL
jgi:hypothetical protein